MSAAMLSRDTLLGEAFKETGNNNTGFLLGSSSQSFSPLSPLLSSFLLLWGSSVSHLLSACVICVLVELASRESSKRGREKVLMGGSQGGGIFFFPFFVFFSLSLLSVSVSLCL